MKKITIASIFNIFVLCSFSQEKSDSDSLSFVIKDKRIDKLNETYKSSYKLIGYRIQIYSGNKRQPANEARSIFLRIYSKKKAHLNYKQPYYKIRVGDFRTKLEALKFKNELLKHFPNCYIVSDEIDVNELY